MAPLMDKCKSPYELRDVEETNVPEIAPGLGPDVADSIEQNRRTSSANSRILRLRIGCRWSENGMRDRDISIFHVPYLRTVSMLPVGQTSTQRPQP
jgi:hypothetical protein